jgi:hypothetical protein
VEEYLWCFARAHWRSSLSSRVKSNDNDIIDLQVHLSLNHLVARAPAMAMYL